MTRHEATLDRTRASQRQRSDIDQQAVLLISCRCACWPACLHSCSFAVQLDSWTPSFVPVNKPTRTQKMVGGIFVRRCARKDGFSMFKYYWFLQPFKSCTTQKQMLRSFSELIFTAARKFDIHGCCCQLPFSTVALLTVFVLLLWLFLVLSFEHTCCWHCFHCCDGPSWLAAVSKEELCVFLVFLGYAP